MTLWDIFICSHKEERERERSNLRGPSSDHRRSACFSANGEKSTELWFCGSIGYWVCYSEGVKNSSFSLHTLSIKHSKKFHSFPGFHTLQMTQNHITKQNFRVNEI